MPKHTSNFNKFAARLRRSRAAPPPSSESPDGITISPPRYMTLRERFIEDGKKTYELPDAESGKIPEEIMAGIDDQATVTTDKVAPADMTQEHAQACDLTDNTTRQIITEPGADNDSMMEKAHYADAATTVRAEMCDASTQTYRHDGGIDPVYLRDLLTVASERIKYNGLQLASFEQRERMLRYQNDRLSREINRLSLANAELARGAGRVD
ncbi:hypothetical protein FPQ18DRAFT_326996 [Pyronema domesticum]|uniref:Uncharacterized protein n=1 Tax=Pyronema omphalodes (strain CBS 100304) TaxID=1076935 RepID=U4LGU1_PYROM|nr:hypothetical protein FPQ18DRAFT_326996 [Pyronema domesticum]CCX10964.1 Protein of unknown function [Pyronema omphalodes CBS 100304]